MIRFDFRRRSSRVPLPRFAVSGLAFRGLAPRSVLGVLLCLLAITSGRADETTLADEVAAARKNFRPVSVEQLSAQEVQVRDALIRLDRFLSASPVRADGWKKYLLWESLLADLNQEAHDFQLWKRALRKYSANVAGLELDPFAKVRREIREFVAIGDAMQVPEAEAVYQQTLDEIAKVLPKPGKRLSAEGARSLSELTSELVRLRQAPELVQRLSGSHAEPNLRVLVPTAMIKGFFDQDIDWPYDYGRYIGGAAVRGDGRLLATLRSSVEWSDSNAAVRLDVEGASDSETWSVENGVGVGTTNSLAFKASSTLQFTPEGILIPPFQATGDLSSRITRMSNSYSGRAASVARSEAYARHRGRLGTAERSALSDVSRGMTEEIGGRLELVDQEYQDRFRMPLVRCDRFPERTQLTSSLQGMEMQSLFADPQQLGAGSKSPAFADQPHLQILCHETALNNTFPATLGGRERSLQETLSGVMPGDSFADANPNALRLRLDESSPLRVVFEADEITIRVRATSLMYQYDGGSGDSEGEITMSFRYRLQRDDENGGWRLVLAEAPQIQLPPLGIRGVTLRRILANILKRDMPEQIEIGRIEPPTVLAGLGVLEPETLDAKDGWLTVRLRPASN